MKKDSSAAGAASVKFTQPVILFGYLRLLQLFGANFRNKLKVILFLSVLWLFTGIIAGP